MARPSGSRKETEAALLQTLELNNLEEKYYFDQVFEYMKYYDNLAKLNAILSKKDMDVEVLREKRQVTREMRSILEFLGLKPLAEGGGGFEEL